MRLLSIDKKKKLKIISLATAIAMVCNAMPMSRLAESIAPFFVVSARAEEYTDVDEVPTDQEFMTMNISADTRIAADAFVSPNIFISKASELADYSYYYVTDPGFASAHFNDCITITIPNTETIDSNYLGIGTEASPFAGQIKFGGENYNINLARSLFNYVYDSVTITNSGDGAVENLNINRTEDVPENTSRPLLADHVKPGPEGSTPASWKVTLASASSHTYSGVIGEICSGAHVNLTFINNSNANVVSNGSGATDKHVGAVCGLMNSDSVLAIDFTETTSSHSITSAYGNAGGLVGTMSGNPTLQIKNMPSASSSKTISSSFYAGGLVGEIFSTGIIDISDLKVAGSPETRIPVAETVSASGGAGGLFGHYINTATEFDLAKYNNTATVSGGNCGGVFGVLENNKDDSAASLELTIKNTSNAETLNVKSGTTANTSGYFGGIAGKYTTNALANSLIIDGITLTAEAKAAYGAFGGVIGIVDSASAAYVQTKNTVTINAKGTDKSTSTYFGGLIGSTGSKGVFVDLGNFTLSNNSESFNGGGIVGQFNNGVLRLHGNTNMSAAKAASGANCGQLVGANDNVLVYATGTGNSGDANWVFNRSNGSKADDLGTWGEVVRIANVEPDILTFDSTAHTVTLAAVTADSTDHDYKIGTPVDLVKTALNIQLNKEGVDLDCLKFTSGSAAHSNILAGNITITNNVSLAGTGITGFMRDGGDVGTLGSYTGTFDGNEHTITLATGESYGIGTSDQTEGMGQIYRHQHNGLFSVLAGTVKDLTVDGMINTHSSVDDMNIGGIAAQNSGNVTLTKVSSNVTVNDCGDIKGTEKAGKNIGGYIGFVGTDGTIAINGVSSIGAKFNLSGKKQDWNTYGGAIGKITAGTFTVNIGTKGDANNKLTNSLITDITGITAVGSNSDSGGLIGYITNEGSYADRQVNINNLDVSGCTVSNAASSTGGGFLGYAWLNTTTTIDGLTTSGTINNTAATKTAGNVGVLLYSSTGKMVVNSLSINGLTMSSGGGTSLGMIVNKAYSLNDKNEVNGALYLDVLNAGYSLTGTNAPTQATGILDEIAAYSAPNVINGGAGVISINMNPDRDTDNASFKTTGTYQNRLKTGNACANSRSRYYYNVDQMSSSDAGQNLVLWSLSKYAYSGIRGEFVHTDTHAFGTTLTTTLSGAADLTGLSFYPLASANDDYSIGALTLTFDYSGIYTTAENVFRKVNNEDQTDEYNRDPALANQHYLMHSGLFIDQPSGKSLTITGKLSLGGTFMEDSTHKGVLISGTENGNFTVDDNGSIELDGIKPMNGASAYKDGYLLINNITRDDDPSVSAPNITIKNVSTTKKYSTESYSADGTNAYVAKSLLGAASGKGLTIIFSKIKLDARDGTNADVKLEALYNAYGTYRSIFSDSTLLASISTDQAATLEYNYTYDEDWGTGTPRCVTYGYEVKESLEYPNKEDKYYGSNRNYTNPINNTNTKYDFSSGFLRYVKEAYNKPANAEVFYREIKVNVMTAELTTGCGTYNDPYIITDGDQLIAVAAILQTNGTTSNLTSVNLPKVSGNYDDLSENTSGDRWCTDKTGTGYHANYSPKSDGTGYTSTTTGAGEWSLDYVKYYLANAYYMIDDSTKSIELGDTYLGLGGTEANIAFRGVIVGKKHNDDTLPTIINTSERPLIKVSNGSVIKDVNIVVASESAIELTQDKSTNGYFGYASQCEYYGGIIGEVMGGDNIIDNSYVNYQYTDKDDNTNTTKIKLKGRFGTIVPVGGYVGVIVFGGVIFKNMTAATANNSNIWVQYQDNNTNLIPASQKEDIYANPIVGRVINGYAVNETADRFSTSEDGHYHDDDNTERTDTTEHTLKNGKKHYTIADIQKYTTVDATNSLSVTPPSTGDGTISAPNAQSLFILSLITQSCAGTAATIGTGANNSDKTVETNRITDESGNVTIYKTRTIIDNSTLGNYSNSLSYGTYTVGSNTSVYGMSHNAAYNNIGTDTSDSTAVNDYNELAKEDTAANTSIPYIVKHYTVGGSVDSTTTTTDSVSEEKTKEVTQTETEEVTHYTKNKMEATTIPSNTKLVMKATRATDSEYLTNSEIRPNSPDTLIYNRNCVLKSTIDFTATNVLTADENKMKNATEFFFESNSSGQYCIYYQTENNKRKYLSISEVSTNNLNRGNLEISDNPCYFTVSRDGTKWTFKWNNRSIYYDNGNGYFSGYKAIDIGSKFELYTVTETTTQVSHDVNVVVPYTETTVTTTTTTTSSYNYPARCVTNTEGYYNINLAESGTYQLPDSFRGLGCVGIYDTGTGVNNPYSIKLNKFDGKGLTIDQDIYLNKFYSDNYFNVLHSGASQSLSGDSTAFNQDSTTNNHGIGLFDSVIMKSGGQIYNFTLKGSVNTEIYNSGSEFIGLPVNEKGNVSDAEILWISTGGVLGWSKGNQALNFNKIILDELKVNGANYVGGLLAHSGNNTNSLDVNITECSARAISIKMSAAQKNDGNPRNAMGTFVGKVKQGKVIVNGNSSTQSNVTIKSYTFGNNTQTFYVSVGGLVGYSGHGFEAYDMNVSSSDSAGTTIGNANTDICGGIIGVMQPYNKGNSDATAIFKNCTVTNLNIHGKMAGGIYGGKWTGSDWVPYRIEIENCSVVGKSASSKNSIIGGDYAGGLVGNGLVYTRKSNSKDDANIIIKDCKVSNYNITSNTNRYSGGFVGYCNSVLASITCYIHDSSVENCVIGQSGENDYAGGAVGGIAKKDDNKILGYNIKLDNVTSPSDRMGAWVGYMADNDSSTSIQFTGMAIYGTGYTKNIGSWTDEKNQSNQKTSFVFADYTGQSKTYSGNTVSNYNKTTGETPNNVEMPKPPYVNINPVSPMGTGEYISSDAAFKRSGIAPAVGGSLSFTYTEGGETKEYTAARTTAAKIYSDIVAGTDTRRYTTFVDSAVTGTNTIKYYLNQKPDADGDRISTYETEKGSKPTGVDDFAVVVIANNESDETTALINRYIQLLTNTSTDYMSYSKWQEGYYNISVETCKYQDGKFVIQDTEKHGLTWTPPNESNPGSFALNGSNADSISSDHTFTLVDVQFKDPLDTNHIAYHLYVPVYTIKQIEVTFSASAMTGTDSVKYQYGESTTVTNKYEADMISGKTHFDGLDTWVTQYIRYTYNKDDINALINSNNLNWHNDKVVKFNTKTASSTFKCLPDNTKMILVNPNGNADSFYYADGLNNNEKFTKYTTTNSSGAEFNNWEIDLSGFKDNGSTAFEPCDIKDLIADKLTVKDDATPKLFTEVDVQNGIVPVHDIYRIDGSGNVHYYTYSSSGNVALAVDSNVNEDYYLSMYVPKSNDLYYYDIIAPEKLEGEKTASVTNGGTNIDSYKYEVMVADLYEQETKVGINKLVVEPGNRQITSSNRELKVDVTTSISINNADAIAYLNNKSPALYHSFNLTFNGKSETGMTTTEIMGYDTANKPTVTATHTIDDTTTASTYDLQKNYLNVKNGNIGTKLYNKQLDPSNKQPLIIKSQVSIKFDDDLLDEQFPQGTAESNTGLYVAASTNLAYDQAKLAYTNMSVPYTPDSNYYYREAANTAKLQYTAENELDEYDNFGKLSQNYSRLGINGKGLTSETYMPVNTVAGYDVTNLTSTELEDADYVRLTLTLSKKTDTKDPETGQVTKAEYSAVDMSKYLSAVTVKSGTFSSSSPSPLLSGNSLVVDIPKDRCSNSSNVYTFRIQFLAKTGAGFTDYANYKMTLKAEMLNEHKNGSGETVKDIIGNSVKSDYVVYTNAKVIPDILGSNT